MTFQINSPQTLGIVLAMADSRDIPRKVRVLDSKLGRYELDIASRSGIMELLIKQAKEITGEKD